MIAFDTGNKFQGSLGQVGPEGGHGINPFLPEVDGDEWVIETEVELGVLLILVPDELAQGGLGRTGGCLELLQGDLSVVLLLVLDLLEDVVDVELNALHEGQLEDEDPHDVVEYVVGLILQELDLFPEQYRLHTPTSTVVSLYAVERWASKSNCSDICFRFYSGV